MHIQSVSIENYKSFLDRQTLHLESGFNLLVGSNNSGKTTILDVVDMDLSLNEPHRSELTIPIFGGQPTRHSEFEVTLVTRFGELWRLLGSSQLYLPYSDLAANKGGVDVQKSIRTFVEGDGQLQIISKFGYAPETLTIEANDLVRGVASTNDGTGRPAALIQRVTNQPDLRIQMVSEGWHGNVATYGQVLKSRIYRFNAQRRPGTTVSAQGSGVLDREATTLPFCISDLQTNDAHGHKILCNWVNRVFPSVKWIQAPSRGGTYELKCLPHSPESRRDDLAIPLSRMGSGIGNVIAMLYVVLTSRDPQVIAIDEPNAFLHPKALRELLAILEAEGKQHQFILTAHSADVLTAVKTQTVSMLNFDGIATTVTQVGQKDLHTLRGGLAELGIRMTDLHAKDRVFWVEGQTEELVMPQLLRWACPEVAAGTSILRVERTGTFSKNGIEPAEIAKIYERLSTSSAFVPPMVAILLDGEKRSVQERAEIEKSSRGQLRFLDRRMLENYLLHSGAVLAAITELGQATSEPIVRDALTQAIGTTNMAELDGAVVLKQVFAEISDAAHEFRKTRDVPNLIDWILENDPDYLASLRVCLRKSFGLLI